MVNNKTLICALAIMVIMVASYEARSVGKQAKRADLIQKRKDFMAKRFQLATGKRASYSFSIKLHRSSMSYQI